MRQLAIGSRLSDIDGYGLRGGAFPPNLTAYYLLPVAGVVPHVA